MISGELEKSYQIDGGTDGTTIGNDGTRLTVQASSGLFYCKANQLYSIGTNVTIPTSGQNNPLLLLNNPSGSGLVVVIQRVSVSTTGKDAAADFKVFSSPTVSNAGTAAVESPRNIGNSQPTAVAIVTTTPTVSVFGNQLESHSVGQNTAGAAILLDGSIILQPNNTLLIAANPFSNNIGSSITIVWVEVPV